MGFLSLINKAYQYLRSDPDYLARYCTTFFLPGYRNNVVFFDDSDVIIKIKKGETLIRIGDGEAGLLHGGHVSYQEYNKNLADSIKNIIQLYGKQEGFILAIPRFVNMSNDELKSTKGGLRCWLPFKIEFRRFFSQVKLYADAHLFYRKNNVDFLVDYLQKRKLLVVTTEKNINKLRNVNLFYENSLFFIVPEPNPFSGYERVSNEIKKQLLVEDISQVTILLSAGPLSKVLAYDFFCKGVQSIDIGLGIESLHTKLGHEKNI